MRTIIIALVFISSVFATSYTSTATGTNWSQSTHWSPTGIPGDGDCVSIGHNTVVNQDVGTAGNGIRTIKLTAGAVTFTPGVTITFGSTGTDPIGSGTATAPDCATATMFGLVNYAAGTVNAVGTANSRITFTTGNGTSPTYLFNYHSGANMTLQYFNCYHCGTATANYQGVAVSTGYQNFTLLIDHCWFVDLYGIRLLGPDPAVFTITSNYFTTGRASGVNGDIAGAASSAGTLTITDNTVTAPVNDSYFVILNAYPAGSSIARNAVFGTSGASRELVFLPTGTSGHSMLNNLVINSQSTCGAGLYGSQAESSTTTVQGNYIAGSCFSAVGISNSASNVITLNFFSQEDYSWRSQGLIQGSGVSLANISYNVMLNETAGSGGAAEAMLLWGSGITSNTVNHNTMLGPPCNNGGSRSANSLAMSMGEPGDAGTGNIFKNNIVCGWVSGYYDDSGVAYAADYASVGVHHSAFFDNTVNFLTPNGNGEANFGTGHPNAAYGELSLATSPQFVGPTRRAATWDSTLGGPGTNANVFTELAKRSGFGGTYNSAYNIPDLMTFVLYGFRPLNPLLRGAASDGTTIGAVQSGLTSVSRAVSGRVAVSGKVQ